MSQSRLSSNDLRDFVASSRNPAARSNHLVAGAAAVPVKSKSTAWAKKRHDSGTCKLLVCHSIGTYRQVSR